MGMTGSCQAAMGGGAVPLRDSAHSHLQSGRIVFKYHRRETVFSSWKSAEEIGVLSMRPLKLFQAHAICCVITKSLIANLGVPA